MSSGRGEEGVLYDRGCVRAWCIFGGWCLVVVQLGRKAGLSTSLVGVVAGVAGCSIPRPVAGRGAGAWTARPGGVTTSAAGVEVS